MRVGGIIADEPDTHGQLIARILATRHENLGAFFCQTTGTDQADPARSTRDDDTLVEKPTHRSHSESYLRSAAISFRQMRMSALRERPHGAGRQRPSAKDKAFRWLVISSVPAVTCAIPKAGGRLHMVSARAALCSYVRTASWHRVGRTAGMMPRGN
jgi:hypothetical protein